VQPGQRVQGVEELLGKGRVRQCAGRHMLLLGKRVIPSAAFLRLVRLRCGSQGRGQTLCSDAMETIPWLRPFFDQSA
jgi:hypothetical protein